jgi:hypothetical protein
MDHCSSCNRPLWVGGISLGGRVSGIWIQSDQVWEDSRPCPVFACYTLAFSLKLKKKHGKPSVTVMMMWSPFTGSLNKSVHFGLSWISQETQVNLCRAYLLGCHIMGFPTPAFSRISWLKFWCGQQRLELLNPCECVCHQCTKVHQWQVKTPELMHLFLLIWVSAPNLHVRHALSITGEMRCLYSRSPFLMETTPSLWATSFPTWSIRGNQVSCVSRVTPWMGCADPVDWLSEEVY